MKLSFSRKAWYLIKNIMYLTFWRFFSLFNRNSILLPIFCYFPSYEASSSILTFGSSETSSFVMLFDSGTMLLIQFIFQRVLFNNFLIIIVDSVSSHLNRNKLIQSSIIIQFIVQANVKIQIYCLQELKTETNLTFRSLLICFW